MVDDFNQDLSDKVRRPPGSAAGKDRVAENIHETGKEKSRKRNTNHENISTDLSAEILYRVFVGVSREYPEASRGVF